MKENEASGSSSSQPHPPSSHLCFPKKRGRKRKRGDREEAAGNFEVAEENSDAPQQTQKRSRCFSSADSFGSNHHQVQDRFEPECDNVDDLENFREKLLNESKISSSRVFRWLANRARLSDTDMHSDNPPAERNAITFADVERKLCLADAAHSDHEVDETSRTRASCLGLEIGEERSAVERSMSSFPKPHCETPVSPLNPSNVTNDFSLSPSPESSSSINPVPGEGVGNGGHSTNASEIEGLVLCHKPQNNCDSCGLTPISLPPAEISSNKNLRRKLNCRKGAEVLPLVAACYICFILSSFPLLAVLHVIKFESNLNRLERDSIHRSTVSKFTSILQDRERTFQQTYLRLVPHEGDVDHIHRTIQRSHQEIVLNTDAHDFETKNNLDEIKRHGHVSNRASSLIESLNGNEQYVNIDLDDAWRRMDDLLKEKNRLIGHVKRCEKARACLTAQIEKKDDAATFIERQYMEQSHLIDSLTREIELTTREKRVLQAMYTYFVVNCLFAQSQYKLLHDSQDYMMDFFFAPLLGHVEKLHHTSEKQHALILELTTLVQSLHSSLEAAQSNLRLQTSESFHAVDAVAVAAIELSAQQERRHQSERAKYRKQMEDQLEKFQNEALSAVQAVSETAGKLEYDRKVDEQTRWSQYIEEVSEVLEGVGFRVEVDLQLGQSSVGETNESNNNNKEIVEGNDIGLIETSMLRAAIGRRIGEAIVSLCSYFHPHEIIQMRGNEEADSDSMFIEPSSQREK